MAAVAFVYFVDGDVVSVIGAVAVGINVFFEFFEEGFDPGDVFSRFAVGM